MLFCHLQAKLFWFVCVCVLDYKNLLLCGFLLNSFISIAKCLTLTWNEMCVKVQEKMKASGNEVGVQVNPWGQIPILSLMFVTTPSHQCKRSWFGSSKTQCNVLRVTSGTNWAQEL